MMHNPISGHHDNVSCDNVHLKIWLTVIIITVVKPVTSGGLFLVPFEQDEQFIGRDDIIGQIESRFQSGRRVALAGPGGVG